MDISNINMTCVNCGHKNPILKKTCEECYEILVGYTINNVSGEWGYRAPNGYFYETKEEYERSIK